MPGPVPVLLYGMTAGVITLVAVLAAATVFGLVWRRRQGRLRAPRRAAAAPPGQQDAAAAPDDGARSGAAARQALTAADLRHELGARATLVQFSSAFCAPCRTTRRVLTEVAGMLDDVGYVEIDAESRLDLVRRLNIYSTPAVMVLAADGSIVRQATGQPRKADVIAVLGDLPAPDGQGQGLPVNYQLTIETVDKVIYAVRVGSDSHADPA